MKHKNNYFKKILSLVLVLLMIFNITIISYADNNTNDGLLISPNPNSLISTNTNNNYNEIYTNDELVIINEIYASGIMKGTDEGFLGHKSLTRAEAITIILRMKGISDTIINSYSSSNNSNNYDGNFTDVPKTHWAYNYINYAYDLDLVNGVSQGIYEPDREVTIVEFLAMCIRALNMDKLVLADTTYEWPINYLNYAIELNLLDNVYTNYQSNATRLDSASIVINTINTPMWEKDKVSTNKEVSYALNNNYLGVKTTAVEFSTSAGTYEIIYVNDGSRDGTMTQLREIAGEDSHVRVFSFSRNFGHQIAVTAGLDYAAGDAIVIIVSEETGSISLAEKGEFTLDITPEELEQKLRIFTKGTKPLEDITDGQ